MSSVAAVAIAAGVTVLLGLLFVALRRPVQARAFRGTGLEEWRRVSRDLSQGQRWALYRANSAGRAAPPDLAGLAVQRGEALCSALERSVAKASKFRLLWLLLGLFSILAAGVNLATIVTSGGSILRWTNVGMQAILAVLWLTFPVLQTRQLRRIQRSVELNRTLVREASQGSQ